MANKNGSKWIRAEKRLAIYMRDAFRCGYCDRDLSHVRSPHLRTLDHVIPRSASAKPDNTADNLITCCKRCNDLKACKNAFDFLRGDQVRIDRLVAQLAKPIDVRAALLILEGK